MQASTLAHPGAARASRLGARLAKVRNRIYHRYFKFPHERRRYYEALCRGAHPFSARTRAALAAQLENNRSYTGDSATLATQGHFTWSGENGHPLSDAVVDEARAMLNAGALKEMKAACRERQLNLAVRRVDGEMRADSPLLRFALDARVLATATRYLGVLPVLDGIYLWYSPNERLSSDRNSSQLFHIDPTGYRELKMFVHVDDVSTDSGPLTIVPAPASRKLYPFFAHQTGSIGDEEVERIVGRDCIVPLTGPTGTVSGADTSTCFHFGSRQGTRDRLLVHFHFMSPYVPRFPFFGRLHNDRFVHIVNEDTPLRERWVLGCNQADGWARSSG
jgi:hypothetical protein